MIRNISIVGILLIALFQTGCKKEQNFVPGQVLFGLYDNVSFRNGYSLFNQLDLEIRTLYDFQYELKTVEDSVDTIQAILDSKPYLTSGNRTSSANYFDSTIVVSANFFDMNDDNASDWFHTIDYLGLTENLTRNSFKWGSLNVPVGQERFWVDQLKRFDIISSAQLNSYL